MMKSYSSSSSKEVVVHDVDDEEGENCKVDLGVGRSYECVFCKRGFNTAQALGGHMNIHRKHRAARNKTNSSTTNHLISSRPEEELDHHHLQPKSKPLDHGNWRMRSLSLGLINSTPPDLHKINSIIAKENDDVDLELRLGYH